MATSATQGTFQEGIQVGQQPGQVNKLASVERIEQIRKYIKGNGGQVFTVKKDRDNYKKNREARVYPEAGLDLEVLV